MKKIVEATQDIVVQIVFNNAGYLSMGFFRQHDIEKLIGNLVVVGSDIWSSIDILLGVQCTICDSYLSSFYETDD